ncbi:MAG: phenylalanine--tRNA ligase subunit beta [Bacteroidetes bacterium]|nr:phenylalanine--tRNA ligase subunit beta [Bacteroidota bacterium]
MRISFNWLKTYIDSELSVDEMAEILTNTGLEVESIETNVQKDKLSDSILVGLVKSCEKHPQADQLTICKVDVGKNNDLQIICGASNVAEGQKVAVATVGTLLHPDSGKSFKIKKAKLRGEQSEGMICSSAELGLGNDSEGILVLDENISKGTAFKDSFDDKGDAIIEIAITPNRGDAISYIGIARDISAVTGSNINRPPVDGFKVDNNTVKINLSIAEEDLCPRYSAVAISDLQVTDSPDWLQNRLKSVGLKPVNNIVDACNYLMFENGQPLHAFDLEKIDGKRIVVKTRAKGEKFKTLDESEVKLSGEEVMICDAENAVAMGGVMGGFSSMVTGDTTSILIESACFNPTSIRKTARHHAFFTDAAYRFERGTDPNFTVHAVKRAAMMIQEIAGGKISSDVFDSYPKPIEAISINLSVDYVNKILGNRINVKRIVQILKNLEYSILDETEKMIHVEVPTYRADVTRPIDLVEEILRIYSYNKIEFGPLVTTPLPESKVDERSVYQNGLLDYLTSSGFHELITPSFVSSAIIENDLSGKKAIKALNAVNTNLDTLRNNFLFSGLDAMAYNYKRNHYNLKLFEWGRIYFHQKNGKYAEEEKLAIWLSGNISDDSWTDPNKKTNIYFLKSIVHNLILLSGVSAKMKEESIEDSSFHYLISLQLNGKELASFGLINTDIVKNYDIKDAVYYAELNAEYLYKQYRKKKIQYQAPSRFPFILRDLSILIGKEVKYADLKSSIEGLNIEFVKEINLVDVYQGNKLEKDKKSYTIRMKFQDDENTLKDKQVDSYISTIINVLEIQHKAIIRK